MCIKKKPCTARPLPRVVSQRIPFPSHVEVHSLRIFGLFGFGLIAWNTVSDRIKQPDAQTDLRQQSRMAVVFYRLPLN